MSSRSFAGEERSVAESPDLSSWACGPGPKGPPRLGEWPFAFARRGRRVLLTLLVFVLVGVAPAPPLGARTRSIVVIAHPSAKIREVSPAELRAIYTVTQIRFSSGVRAIPFAAPARSDLRVAFDRAVLGMDPERVAKFWIDQRIRGKARPPRQVNDIALVPKLVAALPGAIAYAYDDVPRHGVVVVARIAGGKVLPPEKGNSK